MPSYTQSQAFPGKGSVVARSDDATPTAVYTTIGEVKEIKPSGRSIDQYDATNMESGAFKEYKPGLIDNGTIDITVNSVPGDAGQALIDSDFESGAIHTWGIKLPASSIETSTNTTPEYYTFKAFIKEAPLGDLSTTKLSERTIKLQITGSITVTPEGTAVAPF